MNIVFNINRFGLVGLGATLSSLLRNCSNNSELILNFLCSDLTSDDKVNIRELLKKDGFTGVSKFINFKAEKEFGHLKSLHGDWTTYGRLLIPSLIKDDYVLYLDADLLVLLDVLELKGFDFKDNILAAVYGASIRHVLDKTFFIDLLNWDDSIGYFNAGVLLFNLRKWREEDYDNKIKTLTKKYFNDLTSHDQTLLNAISKGKFAKLPDNFNKAWYPDKVKPENIESSIIHFVGSPKPWDFLGNVVHRGYSLWHLYTYKEWKIEYCSINSNKLKRAWKIRRSLLKSLKNRLIN